MTHQTSSPGIDPEGNQVPLRRLSVILSYYNLEQYLSEAIESIRSQTFRDFELLLLDDGSTDSSPAIAERHAAADSRIRIIRSEKNTGISKNINRGLAEAREDWVALMDGDDISHPERFMRQITYLSEHRDVICVGCIPLMVDERRNPIGVLDIYREQHEEIEELLLSGHGWAFLAPTAVFRRDIALQVGGYREDFATSMDGDFFLKLSEVGRIANVPEILFEYRQRAKSITHARQAGQAARHNQMLVEAYRRRGLPSAAPEISAEEVELTRTELHLKWGWWALAHGYPQTASRQGLLALRRAPWSAACWQLLACAVRDLLVQRQKPGKFENRTPASGKPKDSL